MREVIVDLIRHGEPVGGKRYRGQIDDPLSEKGWQQMRSAVQGYRSWKKIVTSPLSRCSEFARELGEKLNIDVEEDARFKEIGFGAWEGRTAAELMEFESDILLRFWSDPVSNRPEGAERLADFSQRVTEAWNQLLEKDPNDHLLVVCHAGVIRMILAQVLMMKLDAVFRTEVKNASITRIAVNISEHGIFPRLVFHNRDISA